MPQLDISTFPSQLFWLVLSFGLLYFILSRVIMPRISEVLEARDHKISSDLDRAESLKVEAESCRRDYEKMLLSAREHVAELMKNAQDVMIQDQDAQHGKLDLQLQSQLREAEIRIKKKKEELEAELAEAAVSVTEVVVDKMIGTKPTPKQVRDAIAKQMEGSDAA